MIVFFFLLHASFFNIYRKQAKPISLLKTRKIIYVTPLFSINKTHLSQKKLIKSMTISLQSEINFIPKQYLCTNSAMHNVAHNLR